MAEKGVFFDLDGTLWEASDLVAESWSVCLKEETNGKVSLSGADMRNLMGKLLEEIARIILPEEKEERRQQILEKCTKVEEMYLRERCPYIFDKEYETLKKLVDDGYKLAVISNCQCGYIEIYIDHCTFSSFFSDTECAGNTGMLKSDNIKLVCERNGISPQNCVYVGDTAGDESAARSAGVKFIHAAYGYGKALSPDAVANNIEDIYGLVKNLI